MLRGELFPLETWAPPTCGSACSSPDGGGAPFPTPTASSGTGPGRRGEGGENLQTAVAELGGNWPSPRASDGPHGGPNQTGSKGDLALPAAVQRNWATPQARDFRSGKTSAATAARNCRPLSEQVETGQLPGDRGVPEEVQRSLWEPLAGLHSCGGCGAVFPGRMDTPCPRGCGFLSGTVAYPRTMEEELELEARLGEVVAQEIELIPCPPGGDYPTPTASSYGTLGGRPGLETMARSGNWATPQAFDATGLQRSPEALARARRVGGCKNLREEVAVAGRMLNPRWVEALMGFPVGWTSPDGPPLRG